MTALAEYERLESGGLWRASPEAQRRDVIVSFGDATLVISDSAGRALTHWSLPAIARVNAGERPAIFSPDDEATETLELDEPDMIEAIERVRKTIARRRPRPGRLRYLGSAVSITLVAAMAVFWLPDALTTHTVSVVPEVKRLSIGRTLSEQIERVAGAPCRSGFGMRALSKLRARVLPELPDAQLLVVPAAPRDVVYLPGDIVILNRALLEDHEGPEVVAGYILAARAAALSHDPLEALLRTAGLGTTFRLLTTGDVLDETLTDYGEVLLSEDGPKADVQSLLYAFEVHGVPSTAYAYAVDVTGESTLDLIEADPFANGTAQPILSDGDWVSLQGICGG